MRHPVRVADLDDDEDDRRRLESWVAVDLPSLCVAGWSTRSVGTTGTSVGHGGNRVATSLGWSYRGPGGHLVEIEAVRPDTHPLEQERNRAASNLLFSYARAVLGPNAISYSDEVERVKREIASGRRTWRAVEIPVDRVPVQFEVMVLGAGFWVAVGQLRDAVVNLRSHGASLEEVALETKPE